MQLGVSDTKVAGQFTLRKRCAITNEIKQEVGPFSNLITDLGLNRMGSIGIDLISCYVGTGTVPPTVGDTTMSTFKVASNSKSAGQSTSPSAPDWFSQYAYTYTFNAGTINGNITEVGVGWGTNPLNNLWSRELIVDSEGNPIAITVLENEILEVVYALRQYHDTSDFTGSFTLNSIVYNYVGRAISLGSAIINLNPIAPVKGLRMAGARSGAVTLGPFTGDLTGGTAITQWPAANSSLVYENLTYRRDCITSVALGQGNSAGGIKGFNLVHSDGASMLYNSKQVVLDNPIPKTDLNTMTFTWRHSWSRYTPPGP